MVSSKTIEKTPAHRLRDAASSGNLDELTKLVRAGTSVDDRSSFNNTALLYAALHGKGDCIKFLIENGADVNITNDTGYTPLICASKNGDYELVKMLLEAGAETWHTLKEEDGSPPETERTATFLAKYRGHSQVVALLEGVRSLQPA